MSSFSANPAADRGLRQLRGLIIDDNAHMRRILHTLLFAFGIRDLHHAADGQRGLAVLNHAKPDFVLCDYNMRPMNGLAFAQAMRRSCPPPLSWAPIIMVTAHTERRHIELARDAGITELLQKPVTAHNLYDRLVQIIERPRQFVNTPNFAGPDRRRRIIAGYDGPRRRAEDRGADVQLI